MSQLSVSSRHSSPSPTPPGDVSPSLKRKDPPDDRDEASFALPRGRQNPHSPQGEYETGRVICEVCGGGVSFRDEQTGGFTLKHWEAHRHSCGTAPHVASGDPVIYTPESTAEALAHPPAKRRRAKRTEEERIEYLRSDPYVAQFEAYRVLCASCDKWIRLRPNSTYCSIPWDAHRKSCLAKKINSKNVYALEERNTLFSKDPDVRKFDAERVLCNMCDRWIAVDPDDHLQAVQKWLQHRASCQKGPSNMPPSSTRELTIPPPPADHLPSHGGFSSSSRSASGSASVPPVIPSREHATQQPSSGRGPTVVSPSSFLDLTPGNYAPAHESRRRNAEQRAATLRADHLIGEVEPNRVFCSLCQKWVQLRQDSSYCAYPWLQHRSKCLARHQRRAEKAAVIADYKAKKDMFQDNKDHTMSDAGDASEDPESEEGIDSEPEDDNSRKPETRTAERHKDNRHGMVNFPPPAPQQQHHQSPLRQRQSSPRPNRHPECYAQPQPGQSRNGYASHMSPMCRPDARGSTQRVASPSHATSSSRPSRLWIRDPDAGGDADAEGDAIEEDERLQQRPFVRPTVRNSMRRPWPIGLADLDSPAGRRHFIFASIDYLFSTTYEATDDMSVSALLTYLNAAMPLDKHEDFDTTEVVKAVAALHDKGRIRFEGDMLRLVD